MDFITAPFVFKIVKKDFFLFEFNEIQKGFEKNIYPHE